MPTRRSILSSEDTKIGWNAVSDFVELILGQTTIVQKKKGITVIDE